MYSAVICWREPQQPSLEKLLRRGALRIDQANNHVLVDGWGRRVWRTRGPRPNPGPAGLAASRTCLSRGSGFEQRPGLRHYRRHRGDRRLGDLEPIPNCRLLRKSTKHVGSAQPAGGAGWGGADPAVVARSRRWWRRCRPGRWWRRCAPGGAPRAVVAAVPPRAVVAAVPSGGGGGGAAPGGGGSGPAPARPVAQALRNGCNLPPIGETRFVSTEVVFDIPANVPAQTLADIAARHDMTQVETIDAAPDGPNAATLAHRQRRAGRRCNSRCLHQSG